MTPRTDLVLFLDLEATGNTDLDEIVEVGLSMIETQGWTEVGSYSRTILPTSRGMARIMATPVVKDMHEKSGLLRDLAAMQDMADGVAHTDILSSIDIVDRDIEQWLDAYLKGDKNHIPYGGSGVSHYDRKYITKYLPRLDKRITFWALDVGPIRRTARLAGRTDWPNQDDKAHRALADARFHADEFRFALKILAPMHQQLTLPEVADELG